LVVPNHHPISQFGFVFMTVMTAKDELAGLENGTDISLRTADVTPVGRRKGLSRFSGFVHQEYSTTWVGHSCQ
jgi:hypothetical protein